MNTCKCDWCTDSIHAKGYCKYHYGQVSEGKAPSKRTRLNKGENVHCSFSGCDRPHCAKGYCSGHYRQLNNKEPLRPLRSMAKFGSGWINSHGYKQVIVDKKTIPEHRHVMEVKLGRKLFPHENVHHINGDKLDNRIENLELWSTSQPSGQRVADKISWAKYILETYDGMIDP